MEVSYKEKVIRTITVKVFLSDLIFFLKENECLKQFENYVDWTNLQRSTPQGWIFNAFNWDSTGGYSFWENIHKEWQKYLHVEKKEDVEVSYESSFTIK